jgi:hypothetical protein
MKTIDHDYLVKVQNNDEGWTLIYKIVLRGRKPLTPWGKRPSITLDQAQEICLYIRLKV